MKYILIISFIFVISGCSPQNVQMNVPEPPQTVLDDCEQPKIEGKKNKDLAKAYIKMKESIEKCNLDKKLLRDIFKQTEKAK